MSAYQFKYTLKIMKNNKQPILKKGTPIGLCDSNGIELKVGSIVRQPTTINTDVHGLWVEYEITLQGITPLTSYFRSEKGQVLPIGYSAAPLSDSYDQKMFVFAQDSLSLRPITDLVIV